MTGGQAGRMYYSEEFIEEVRQRNDIVDVISGYVNLKKKREQFYRFMSVS